MKTDYSSSALLIVGHGSTVNPDSSAPTLAHASEIRRRDGVPFPNGIKEHYVKETWFFDVLASYTFKFSPPLESHRVSGYLKEGDEVVRGKDGESNESVQTVN